MSGDRREVRGRQMGEALRTLRGLQDHAASGQPRAQAAGLRTVESANQSLPQPGRVDLVLLRVRTDHQRHRAITRPQRQPGPPRVRAVVVARVHRHLGRHRTRRPRPLRVHARVGQCHDLARLALVHERRARVARAGLHLPRRIQRALELLVQQRRTRERLWRTGRRHEAQHHVAARRRPGQILRQPFHALLPGHPGLDRTLGPTGEGVRIRRAAQSIQPLRLQVVHHRLAHQSAHRIRPAVHRDPRLRGHGAQQVLASAPVLQVNGSRVGGQTKDPPRQPVFQHQLTPPRILRHLRRVRRGIDQPIRCRPGCGP